MKPLSIVQISDMHLFADLQGELAGRNTFNSFIAVRDLMLAKHPQPDMIMLTGDLSQDYSEASYRHLLKALLPFTCPIYWIPGNHDHAEDLGRIMATSQCQSDKEIVTDAWHIIMLDSSVYGRVFGELAEEQLQALQLAVNRYPDKYLMICLHHHPIPINMGWMNPLGLQQPQRFLDIVKAHDNLRLIVWGHIHQQFEWQDGNVQYLSVPSTCLQFLPNTEDFVLDTRLPGYRWFELFEGGRVKTGVNRLAVYDDNIDYSSTGY